MPGLPEVFSADLLSRAPKVRLVDIQSYMDAKYSKYRSGLEFSSKIHGAKWTREHILVLLRDLHTGLLTKALLPLEVSYSLLRQVQAEDLDSINEIVDAQWSRSLSRLPSLSLCQASSDIVVLREREKLSCDRRSIR